MLSRHGFKSSEDLREAHISLLLHDFTSNVNLVLFSPPQDSFWVSAGVLYTSQEWNCYFLMRPYQGAEIGSWIFVTLNPMVDDQAIVTTTH